MKGLISGIKRMEIHDGDGLRTTVFFKGCPLRCIWCHNPEGLSFEKQVAHFSEKCIKCGACKGERSEAAEALCPTGALHLFGKEYTARELVDSVLIDGEFIRRGGGVTFSGGECLMQSDFVCEAAELFRREGISVYIDTSGYVKREVLERIIPYTDKFLYDVKAFSNEVHKRCTGRGNRLILDNLKFLSDKGCSIEIRYPLVTGYNDEEASDIARFLSNLNGITMVRILRYHSFSGSRYLALGIENTLPNTETTDSDISRAVEIFQSFGLVCEADIT